MKLLAGTYDSAWGHTFFARGSGKLYALRSLAEGSGLLVFAEATMEPMGEWPLPGAHPCHITILQHQAVISDYSGGTLTLVTLSADGLPDGDPECIRFRGKGPVPERQHSSHIHCSALSPDGRYLVVSDLGADKLYRFRVDGGRVKASCHHSFRLPAGCGPRHLAFGNGVLYVSTELSDEVLVLSWPGMTLLQRSPINENGPGRGAHLALSPDGRYLYASSRLRFDGIAAYLILENGCLETVQYCETCFHPRHFCISPDGAYLFVACKDQDTIEIFSRSEYKGTLLPSDMTISIEHPVFVECL